MGQRHFYQSVSPEQWERRFDSLRAVERFELAVMERLTAPDQVAGPRCVLDVGCGTGRVAALYAVERYVGVDRAAGLVRYAARHAGGSGASFIVADMERLPFPAGSFDLVVLMGTLESEKELGTRLDMLAPLLRAGGVLFLTLQNRRNRVAWFGNLFAWRYRQTFWTRNQLSAILRPRWGQVEMASVFVLPPGLLRMLFAIIGWIPGMRRLLERAVLAAERRNVERRLDLGYEWQIALRRPISPEPADARPELVNVR